MKSKLFANLVVAFIMFCCSLGSYAQDNILGTRSVCSGATTTLSIIPSGTGGYWSSHNLSIATVGSMSGVVYGVSDGYVNIDYLDAGGGVIDRAAVTVFGNTIIDGFPKICTGTYFTFSGASYGYTGSSGCGAWSSSNTSVATVGTSGTDYAGHTACGGRVYGVSAGTAIVTYTNANGCVDTAITTVGSIAAISGPSTICHGQEITLSSSDPPYFAFSWGSTGGINTRDMNMGVFWGSGTTSTSIATGTVTYTLYTGCYATHIMTVFFTPSIVTHDPEYICSGVTNIIGATPPTGGTWASSAPTVATASTTAGVTSLSGLMAGSSVLTYTLPSGCADTVEVLVGASLPAITGIASLCVGSTTALANTHIGGQWQCGGAGSFIATVGTHTGVVHGVSAGTAIVTYEGSTPFYCRQTITVTVNPAPAAITNAGAICIGDTRNLSNAVVGGVWTSSHPTIASVGTSGVVTGVSASTIVPIISYTLPGGCRATATVTVFALPGAINGTRTVCEGAVVSLSSVTTGCIWSSTDISVATVGSFGTGTTAAVSGILSGTSVISYTAASGCARMVTVTVNPGAGVITGDPTLCIGQSFSFSSTVSGGTWTSSHPTIASVHSSAGYVTASSTTFGYPVINYTMPGGCRATFSVTVYGLPAAIVGTRSVCEGATVTLSTLTTGGIWSSSDITVATIGSLGTGTTGAVTGIVTGTSLISYTAASGCSRLITLTVNPTAGVITGLQRLCLGQSASFSSTVSGGTWTSSHTAIASVHSSAGYVTASSATVGYPTIYYTMPGGCRAIISVTVVGLPSVIYGTRSMCEGAAVTLSSATTGGIWSSGTLSVATVGSVLSGNRGAVTGVLAGTSIISYTASTGCSRLATVTVNPAAGVITGQSTLCRGQSVSFSSTVSGGTWTSSHTTIASVHSSAGYVTASSTLSGSPTISYTMPGGCRSIFPTRVATPSAISGPTSVCGGRTIALGNSVSGGIWSSTDGSIASVGTAGAVLGGAVGVAVISYELGAGCFSTTTITVVPGASPIVGPSSVCYGYTIALTNASSVGTWSSSHPTTASVGSGSGIVTGLAASGTVPTISYTLGSGCFAIHSVTVVYISAISGASSVCQGRTITLGNSAPGGTWSSSDVSVASISPAGIVSGIAPGTSVISYTIGGGSCAVSHTVTVRPYADITGPIEVCYGSSITLSNTLIGGTWSSYHMGIATIGSSSGIVTTVAPSSVPTTITYTMPSGCIDTALVYVRYLAPITGPTSVCEGTTTNLSNLYTGGTWSSSDNSIATIGSSSATVSGVAAGTATFTYTMLNGCLTTHTLTVDPAPPAITGPSVVCIGTDILLSNTVIGGTWTVYYATATIGSTSGIVTGISPSSVLNIVTYTLPTGCMVTTLVEVSSCLRGIVAEDVVLQKGGFVVVPNPSRGVFIVKGSFGQDVDQEITIEVNNMLDQVVHRVVVNAKGGQLATSLQLSDEIPNGMYLLTLSAGTDKKVFHIIISR